jgi:uncharacterized membrane protein
MNTVLIAAVLIGFVAGLRTMTALAAVSWAARAAFIDPQAPWLAWLGYRFTPYVMSVLAAAEFVTDQLPSTPSRKAPPQFGVRIVCGAVGGCAVGFSTGAALAGAATGVVGSIAGTLLGHSCRARLATVFGMDRPAAVIEDVIAVALAIAAIAII